MFSSLVSPLSQDEYASIIGSIAARAKAKDDETTATEKLKRVTKCSS